MQLHENMFNRYDKNNHIDTTQIYLARPGKRILGALNGVLEDTCNLEINLNNTSVLTFDVSRIINGAVSSWYDRIEQHMELAIPGLGWFKINEEPTIMNDGNQETCSVRAESLEIELQNHDLVGFEINTGAVSSREMLATDNTYDTEDGSYTLARDNVRFYRDTSDLENLIESEFGQDGNKQKLLNLISEYPCIFNTWRITFNLQEFNNAIQSAYNGYNSSAFVGSALVGVARVGNISTDPPSHNEQGRDLSVLASYIGNIKTQQDAYALSRLYPVILNYVSQLDVDLTNYDDPENDFTVRQILLNEVKREKDLSLMDLILSETGWHVGYVDPTIDFSSDIEDDWVPLANRIGRFEVDSQDVYSFLTQEVASYFRCVFVFDTDNYAVNCYSISSVGADTNIYLSFHNIQNSVQRSGTEQIVTRFRVEGGDDLDFTEVNLGENIITDISYFLNKKHFTEGFIDKYNAYTERREELRKQYKDLSVKYRNQIDEASEIYDRVPVDGTDAMQYNSFTDEELEEEKAKYEAILRGMQAYYVDENNEFDEAALEASDDYNEYLMITQVILSQPLDALNYVYFDTVSREYVGTENLGNIDIAIFNRRIANGYYISGNDNQETKKQKTDYKKQLEYLDDLKYDYETFGSSYGVAELQTRSTLLYNQWQTLWNQGYNEPPDGEDAYHQNQYELYQKYHTAYDQCISALDERQKEYDDAVKAYEYTQKKMNDLKEAADISNITYGFTEQELNLLERYYIDNDYQNENIITTSIYTNEQIIITEEKLLQVAKEELYAAAHPQWTWETTQDNFLLMPELKDWHGELDVGNFVRVNFREPDPIDLEYITSDNKDNADMFAETGKRNIEDTDDNNLYSDDDNQLETTAFEPKPRDGYQVKLRIVTVSLNPLMINPEIGLTFSSMIQYRSRRNDFVELLNLASHSGKQIIQGTIMDKNLDNTFNIDSGFVMKLLNTGAFASQMNSYTGSIATTAVGALAGRVGPMIEQGVSAGILSATIDVGQLGGDVGNFFKLYTEYLDAGVIVTQLLRAETAEFGSVVMDSLEANAASFTTLLTSSISAEDAAFGTLITDTLSANSATFGELVVDSLDAEDATFGSIITDTLEANSATFETLMANVFNAATGQVFNLTTDNATLNQAFVSSEIAGRLTVGDLATYTATASQIVLISPDGTHPAIAFQGSTQQFYDSDGNVRVQIGQDGNGDFNFVVRSADGQTALFDYNGITQNGIPNNTIINSMISNGTIEKAKLAFDIIEPNQQGGVDITQIYDGQGNLWGTQYTSFKTTTQNTLSSMQQSIQSLSSTAEAVELVGDQIFVQDTGGTISPAYIDINAITYNNLQIGKWYVNNVEDTTNVSQDKKTLRLYSSSLGNNNTVQVRVESQDGTKSDVMTIYKITNGQNGSPGTPGQDSYTAVISSSGGTVFKTDSGVTSTTLTCTLYRGTTVVTPTSYTWYYTIEGGNTQTLGTGASITLPLNSSVIKKSVYCNCES